MTAVLASIPLMLLALAIATVPLLVAMRRERTEATIPATVARAHWTTDPADEAVAA